MDNQSQKPGCVATIWGMTPYAIAIIWVLMMLCYYTVGLPHSVSLPIVLFTIVWFIVWLITKSRQPLA